MKVNKYDLGPFRPCKYWTSWIQVLNRFEEKIKKINNNKKKM